MCEPTTAVVAISTAYNLYQQQQNVDATEKYQKKLHKFNAEVATENALRNYSALQRKQVQERQQAAIDIQKVAQRSAAAQGTARAQAASAGTAGGSVANLLADFEREELAFQNQVLRTDQFRTHQFRDEALGVQAGQYGQILSTLPQPVQQPDYVGAALRITGSAINVHSQRTSAP